jgi:hypothetical protein
MTLPALEAAMPKAPDTPLDSNQALSANIDAHKIAPLSSAVFRVIRPDVRVAIHPPTNNEINKLIISYFQNEKINP